MFGAILNRDTTNLTTLTGSNKNTINTVQRTLWSVGDPQKSGPLNSSLGFVQGFFDFPYTTPGLGNIALLATLNPERIVLAQTGIADTTSGIVTPTEGAAFNAQVNFENGTITETLGSSPTTVVTISGGSLANIGPLTTAEIATDTTGNQSWLFCGGSNGVAVLSTADGNGWAGPLGQNFNGLVAGMSFKPFGDYQLVDTLVYDDNCLYIVTDSKLDRVDLMGGINNPTITTLATKKLRTQ